MVPKTKSTLLTVSTIFFLKIQSQGIPLDLTHIFILSHLPRQYRLELHLWKLLRHQTSSVTDLPWRWYEPFVYIQTSTHTPHQKKKSKNVTVTQHNNSLNKPWVSMTSLIYKRFIRLVMSPLGLPIKKIILFRPQFLLNNLSNPKLLEIPKKRREKVVEPTQFEK